MISFREDAGENRALQIQNGADAGKFPPLPSQKNTEAATTKTGTTVPSRPPIPSRNLRYPKNEQIHDSTDYLKIDIVEYEPIGDKLVEIWIRRTLEKILHGIILPIPPNVQDGMQLVIVTTSKRSYCCPCWWFYNLMKSLPGVLAE